MSEELPDNIIHLSVEEPFCLENVCISDYPQLVQEYKNPILRRAKKLIGVEDFPDDGVVSFSLLKASQRILHPIHNGLNSTILDCIEFIGRDELSEYQKDLLIWDCLRLNIITVQDGINLFQYFSNPPTLELLSGIETDDFLSTVFGLASAYVRNELYSNEGIRFLTNPRVNIPSFFDINQNDVYTMHAATFPRSFRYDASMLFALEDYDILLGSSKERQKAFANIARMCIKNGINTVRDILDTSKVYDVDEIETHKKTLLYSAANHFVQNLLNKQSGTKIVKIENYK